MSLLETLKKIIKTSPDVIQFAKDRKYEEAWIIPVGQEKTTSQEIEQYIREGEYKILIVEYIWNSNVDSERFVLTLFLDSSCLSISREDFASKSFELFWKKLSFEELIAELDKEIIGHEYLLRNPVEGINLGIFNYWLSTNPVELWNMGETYSKEEMIERMNYRPEIKETDLNYQGLLFRFNLSRKYDGPYHAIKTPCCTKLGSKWVVDTELVDSWIGRMLQA